MLVETNHLITRKEAAEILGRSSTWLILREKRGRGPRPIRIGRGWAVYYDKREIEGLKRGLRYEMDKG